MVSLFLCPFGLKIRVGGGGGQGPSLGSVSAGNSSFMFWQLPLGEHTLFSVIFKKGHIPN